jgi:hypothetical protein
LITKPEQSLTLAGKITEARALRDEVGDEKCFSGHGSIYLEELRRIIKSTKKGLKVWKSPWVILLLPFSIFKTGPIRKPEFQSIGPLVSGTVWAFAP